jgi:oligosaccharide repeat unit polymerase
MRILYTLLLAVLLIVYAKVLIKVLRNSAGLTPLLGWMIGLAYFVLGPLVIMTLNGGFELPAAYQVDNRWATVDLTNTKFLLPYLVIWASLLSSSLVVYIFFPSVRQDDKSIYSLSRKKLERALLICMAIAAAIWALQIWLVGGIAQFLVSHWYERGEDLFQRYGDSYVLLAQITLANQLIYTGTAALYTSCGLKDRDTKPWFTVLIIFFFLCSIVMTGNRIFFASYLLACFTSCWLLQRRKMIAMMLALAPVLVLVFSVWSSVRHDLSKIQDSVDTYTDSDYGNRTVTSLINVTEGMSVMLLLHIINDFGNRYEFLDGLTYSRTFTALIPRRIYPHKPENFTLVLAKIYQPDVTTSLNATAVGEMYANFGPLTLCFFPLLTLGVLKLNHWALRRQQAHPLLPAMVFVLLEWVARGTVADNFIHFVLALVLISALRFEKGLRLVRGVGIHSGFALNPLSGTLPVS